MLMCRIICAVQSWRRLQEYAEELKIRAQEMPGLRDVDSTYEGGNPELQVHLNRQKSSDLGVEAADIASTIPDHGRWREDYYLPRGR